MESFLPLFVSFSAFAIFTIIWLNKQNLKRSSEKNQTLPPGPGRLPLIGNLHQLISKKLPHHRLRDLANQYGPMMYLQLGEVPHVIISSPELAKEIMKTHDVNFAQRPRILLAGNYFDKEIVFGVYSERWRMLKKIATEELLSPKRVQSFRGIREKEVSGLIIDLHMNSGSKVNLSSKIFALTYLITSRAAFGKKCKDQDLFIWTANEAVRLAGVFSACDIFPTKKWLHWIGDIRPEFSKLEATLDRVLEDIVMERMASPMTETAGCLLDVLLNIQKNGKLAFPLDTENIKAIISDIFLAGSETSSTFIEWAMLEMLKNPEIMKNAQAEVRRVFEKKENVDEESLHELKYLKMVIKETFRFHPPAPITIPREARESCVINGYYIPPKTRTIINLWAIGRDPRYWNDGERFIPERFVDSLVDFRGTCFELIPFGAGRRICPGIGFAVADIELVLAQLLFHFDWKLPDGIDHINLDMTESFGATVRRKEELWVIPVPHNPNPDVTI